VPATVGATQRVRSVPAAAPPATASGWEGKLTGSLYWSGRLEPGSRVVVSRQRVTEGGGEARIEQLPGFNQINITGVSPRGVTAIPTGANELVIINNGDATVQNVQINWTVRQ
jgi:hypothetical protein